MGKVQGRIASGLKLYVRQLAWLAAVPKPPAGTRRAQSQGEQPRLSRLDQMKQHGITPKLPPNPVPHLMDRLRELGITEAGGMGPAPLSWTTIAAWQSLTQIKLAPWEARLMRTLSLEYLAESHRAESENCPAPWRTTPTAAEIAAEERQLRSVLG